MHGQQNIIICSQFCNYLYSSRRICNVNLPYFLSVSHLWNDGIMDEYLFALKYSLFTVFMSFHSQFFFFRLVLASRLLFGLSYFHIYLSLVPASTLNSVRLIFWKTLKLSKNYTGRKARVSNISRTSVRNIF